MNDMNVRKEMQPSTFIRRCVECMYLNAAPLYKSHAYECSHRAAFALPVFNTNTIPAWCPLPDANTDEGGDA